jgi:glycosyltransferase involved in cell wall biosynthesis
MLVAAASCARENGYRTTVCFSPVARRRPWLGAFDGIADVRFVDPSDLRKATGALRAMLGDRRSGPAVLHTHFGQFDIAAALSARMRGRTVTIWHAHSGSDPTNFPRLRTRGFAALFGRLIDEIICVSPQIYDAALIHGFPPRVLRIVPNAIDTERFSLITDTERRDARAQLGLDQRCRLALQFAWHWTTKGGDRMLAAAARLVTIKDLRILIVVGERPADSPRQQILEHRNIIALSPRENVRDLFAAADVFVNCSRSEGMPYAVLEALSRGLPVLATELPVQRELLGGLPGARVVAPEPASIAAGIQDLLAMDADGRRQHALAARHRVMSSYGLRPWAAELVKRYAELIESHGDRR